MSKITIYITTSLLLIYFIFTSGLAFEITASEITNRPDMPYSFALSGDRTGVVGIFTEDDIECAEWLATETPQEIPILSDINSALLLKSFLQDGNRIGVPKLGRLIFGKEYPIDEYYIFVNTWNSKHQRYIESDNIGEGLRVSHALPELNYPEVHRSGQAIVYLKKGQ